MSRRFQSRRAAVDSVAVAVAAVVAAAAHLEIR